MVERVGPYRIEGEIGRGGMGVVYLAHDTKLDRDVAIKCLPDAFTDDPDRLARFEREAKALASLNLGGVDERMGWLPIDITPDGERFVYIEGAGDDEPLTHLELTVNWLEALDKLVPPQK